MTCTERLADDGEDDGLYQRSIGLQVEAYVVKAESITMRQGGPRSGGCLGDRQADLGRSGAADVVAMGACYAIASIIRMWECFETGN